MLPSHPTDERGHALLGVVAYMIGLAPPIEKAMGRLSIFRALIARRRSERTVARGGRELCFGCLSLLGVDTVASDSEGSEGSGGKEGVMRTSEGRPWPVSREGGGLKRRRRRRRSVHRDSRFGSVFLTVNRERSGKRETVEAVNGWLWS